MFIFLIEVINAFNPFSYYLIRLNGTNKYISVPQKDNPNVNMDDIDSAQRFYIKDAEKNPSKKVFVRINDDLNGFTTNKKTKKLEYGSINEFKNQLFSLKRSEEDYKIYQIVNKKMCLEFEDTTSELVLKKCNNNVSNQLFRIMEMKKQKSTSNPRVLVGKRNFDKSIKGRKGDKKKPKKTSKDLELMCDKLFGEDDYEVIGNSIDGDESDSKNSNIKRNSLNKNNKNNNNNKDHANNDTLTNGDNNNSNNNKENTNDDVDNKINNNKYGSNRSNKNKNSVDQNAINNDDYPDGENILLQDSSCEVNDLNNFENENLFQKDSNDQKIPSQHSIKHHNAKPTSQSEKPYKTLTDNNNGDSNVNKKKPDRKNRKNNIHKDSDNNDECNEDEDVNSSSTESQEAEYEHKKGKKTTLCNKMTEPDILYTSKPTENNNQDLKKFVKPVKKFLGGKIKEIDSDEIIFLPHEMLELAGENNDHMVNHMCSEGSHILKPDSQNKTHAPTRKAKHTHNSCILPDEIPVIVKCDESKRNSIISSWGDLVKKALSFNI
ncbi:hypothetical protein EDEG_00305 [Edhazardia aedis USNM 41457]|uniref:Uncharacterized protein n=1 Tax=Edhazardia aedis (strain USNM 41457) TaxID=1003232 RepID=J9D3W4_EDHAE|nr:hypothetical protein EDEG_00305 [Edhazardia aedis USNM 41457]|eukprot:EJW02234.1 hypothetical protein EDEG_00305 [Edhazardia aedis USNM 41457]